MYKNVYLRRNYLQILLERTGPNVSYNCFCIVYLKKKKILWLKNIKINGIILWMMEKL